MTVKSRRKEQYQFFTIKREATAKMIFFWIGIPAVIAGLMLLLQKAEIISEHLISFLMITVLTGYYLTAAGVILFGMGRWMKKWCVLVLSSVLLLNAWKGIVTVAGQYVSFDSSFLIYIAGNDSGGDLETAGRTDVNMIAAVNANTGRIALVSLPRDTYLPNPAYDGEYDKLTHLGNNGLSNTAEGISELFDLPVEHTVLVNYDSFISMVDELGGITITNPSEFSFTFDEEWPAEDGEQYFFPEGEIELDGNTALYYVRERKSFDDGDRTRNMHQQIVLKAIVRKALSEIRIFNAGKMIGRFSDCYTSDLSETDLAFFAMKMAGKRNSVTFENYGISGYDGNDYCAALDNYAYVMYPDTDDIAYCREILQSVLEGEKEETVNE